ncbi:hypothetical protein SAMN05216167_12197 [Spirosoma endophyticum]|uniref:Uncharacterized protein n=1 Tax=Spirosoma endophyticum TaxID=662367 RepID=A0A1I2EBR3_9BACT|nr:hypothetical protein SAMN05216167_12197 [Spirosoma endophyticum]
MESDRQRFSELLTEYVLLVVESCLTEMDEKMQDKLIKLGIDIHNDSHKV